MRRLRHRYGRAEDRSTGGIHARAATVLGWPLRDVQSMSLHSLRELVRHASPKLAHDITVAIRSGSYIT